MRAPPLALAAAALASVALAASDAPAGCSTGGVFAFPAPKGGLPVNGRIVVEGSGEAAAAVAAIDGEALVLASDGDPVPLRVAAVHRGDWNVSEAVLVPARELAEGARYVLRASASAQGSPLAGWLGRRAPMTWSATARTVAPAPRWTRPPTRGATEVGRGCPPHAYVNVRVPVEHPERLLGVLAEVRPLQRASKPIRFLVEASGGEIALGHFGCQSPFALAPGVMHLVTLTAIDLAGQETPAPGGAIAIVGPTNDR